MSAPDVIVIGGGIIGAAVARDLAMCDLSVMIVDSGTEHGIATQASAGMLAPLAESEIDDPLLGLHVRARDLYRELAPQIRSDSGVDVDLSTDGILKIAFTEEEEDNARADIAWQRQQGLNSEWLPPGDLRQRCPGLSEEIRGAVLFPEDGALDPLTLLEGLLVSATGHGTRIARGEHVERLEISDGRITGVVTDRGTRSAGAIVVAAGAWSGRLDGLPRPLSVEPVRGQMLAVDWPADEPPAIVYTGKGYALRRGAELVAGSTMEHAGFEVAVTREGRDRIRAPTTRLYPALAEAPIRRTWAGLRPGTPDGLPIIGRDPEVEGLWYATGHGRNGILLAAITGEIMASLFTGEETEYALESLAPNRFWAD